MPASRPTGEVLLKPLQQHWSDLRGISNSYAAKATILVPAVGYWIVFNETLVHWVRLATQLGEGTPVGEVPRKLLWLYLGLVLIGITSALYSWRCPRIVKKYGDAADFIKGDGGATSPDKVNEYIDELEERGYAELRDRVTNVWEGKRIDVMEIYYSDLDNREPFSRSIVTILFVCGFPYSGGLIRASVVACSAPFDATLMLCPSCTNDHDCATGSRQ
jgi:hypothetical protein